MHQALDINRTLNSFLRHQIPQTHTYFGRADDAFRRRIEGFLRDYNSLTEEPYEGCMYARIIQGQLGKEGSLLIRFPEMLDRTVLPLHIHPKSDRLIYIRSGEGEFDVVSNGGDMLYTIPVIQGDIVNFPKGTIHTFVPLQDEMSVYAIHNPFQRLDDEEILAKEAVDPAIKRIRRSNC